MSEDRRAEGPFARLGFESVHLFNNAHLFAFIEEVCGPLQRVGDGLRLRGVQKALLLDKGSRDP